jgi:hypothetical protein
MEGGQFEVSVYKLTFRSECRDEQPLYKGLVNKDMAVSHGQVVASNVSSETFDTAPNWVQDKIYKIYIGRTLRNMPT